LHSDQLFRIMAGASAQSALIPHLLPAIREAAPGIALDILPPSDVTFQDLEKGKIDMAINRFDHLPKSLHHTTLWRDTFSCLLSVDNPALQNFTLETYLDSPHVWVSKTGMGVGTGMTRSEEHT